MPSRTQMAIPAGSIIGFCRAKRIRFHPRWKGSISSGSATGWESGGRWRCGWCAALCQWIDKAQGLVYFPFHFLSSPMHNPRIEDLIANEIVTGLQGQPGVTVRIVKAQARHAIDQVLQNASEKDRRSAATLITEKVCRQLGIALSGSRIPEVEGEHPAVTLAKSLLLQRFSVPAASRGQDAAQA